jgi:hypothetical protein
MGRPRQGWKYVFVCVWETALTNCYRAEGIKTDRERNNMSSSFTVGQHYQPDRAKYMFKCLNAFNTAKVLVCLQCN